MIYTMDDHSYSVLSGQVDANDPSPDYMLYLDRIICEFMKDQDIPGASLSISYCGKPLYKQGYGIARCGQRVSSHSYFRLASISKLVTAIGVLRLVEKNLIQLDNRVFGPEGVLPGITYHHDNQADITVLHLLQHSAGWDRDLDGDHVFWYSDPVHCLRINPFDNHALVQYILTYKLAFSPGSRHAYSNLTYLVLGMIIEKISGLNYEGYTNTILEELDIHMYVGKTLQEQCNCFLEVKYFNNRRQLTEQSIYDQASWVAPQYGSFPMENTGSYGGLVTCAENLVRLLDNLIMTYEVKHVLLQSSVDRMMKKPRYIAAASEEWYGLGLDVEDCGQSFGHTGAMDGTSTSAHHDKSGFTWALLFNSWAKDMDFQGLMKYALSTIRGYSLWQGIDHKLGHDEWLFTSQDRKQCVSVNVPVLRLMTHALEMKNKGYEVGYISSLSTVYGINFNVIWNKMLKNRNKNWSIILNVHLPDFDNFVSKLNKDRKSVTLSLSYVTNHAIHHMFVVYDREDTSQRIYCVEGKDHAGNLERNVGLGLTLMCQWALYFNGKVYVTAVYRNLQSSRKAKESSIIQDQWTSLPVDEFVSSLQEKTEQQYGLDYLQFYTLDSRVYVSAIWTKRNITRNAFQRHIVYQRYNVGKFGLINEIKESLKKNQPVKCLCSYSDEDVKYFVCIWGRYNRTNKL